MLRGETFGAAEEKEMRKICDVIRMKMSNKSGAEVLQAAPRTGPAKTCLLITPQPSRPKIYKIHVAIDHDCR